MTSLGKMCGSRGTSRDAAEGRDGSSAKMESDSGNVLPLNESKLKTIAVIGPDAYPAVPGGGGSSETKPFNAVSYLEGISNPRQYGCSFGD
jgi:hypothetical protein